MKIATTFVALVGSAAAFAPSLQNSASSTIVRAGLDDMDGSTLPIPKFDPLGIANLGSEETLRWFRAA